MKQARPRNPAPAVPRRRDLAGAADAGSFAAATRQVELRRLLDFAAARRLVRLTRAGRPTAAPQPAGANGPILRRRQALTPDLLILEVDRPPDFDYRPGQHVKLGVAGLLRNYSMVSAPHQPRLEFLVALQPGGRLAERLRRLSEGAAVSLGSRPRGAMSIRTDRPHALLVATGSGIAPFLSLLRHHTRHGRPAQRFVVLHGASHPDELAYAGEMSALARRHPGHVHYLATVSRPEAARSTGWQGATGRVEAHLADVLERFGLTGVNTGAVACGNSGMVKTVADALRRQGYRVQTETFD